MEKIEIYQTAGGSSPVKLDAVVNGLIAKGYIPFGNPYMSGDQACYCQAMVKIAESEKTRVGALR